MFIIKNIINIQSKWKGIQKRIKRDSNKSFKIQKGDWKGGIQKRGVQKGGIQKGDSKGAYKKGDSKRGVQKGDSKRGFKKGDLKTKFAIWTLTKNVDYKQYIINIQSKWKENQKLIKRDSNESFKI